MEFQQYWSILKRRCLPASLVFSAVSILTVFTLRTQDVIYQAQGKLRFTRDATPSLTGVGEERDALAPLIAENNPISTEMGIIRSVPTVQQTIDRLNLKDENGNELTPNQFLSHLSLQSERGTDLLEISYTHPNPQEAKAVVDTLMKVYLDKNLQDNRAQTVAAREFIEEQLPKAEASVRQAEATLRQFKEANQVASLEEEAAAIVTAQEELRRRITEAQSELANANAQVEEFYNQLKMNPQEAIAVTSLSQSAGVQEALTQLQTIESELATERARFFDEHPVIADLEARRANLLAVLDQRIDQTLLGQSRPNEGLQIGELKADLAGEFVRSEITRRGLSNEVNTLNNAQAFYEQRINALPRLEQEQRELTRRLEAAQSTYSLLLSKLYEIQVAENQNVGNARIVQEAYVLEEPVAPRPLSHMATGGILAVLGAIATALALEAMDKSIRTIREAREVFGMTLLAVLPFYKNNGRRPFLPGGSESSMSEVIVRDLPTSPISETYRMLQANLKFLSSDHPLKTIVITSSVPQEGKSVVTANLAMVMAQSGHNVLIVDADMRSPRQHKIWDVLNEAGLSNVIVEQRDPTTVIKEVAPNLDVLTSGVIPPNPTALLDSQRMAALIAQVSQHYRFVIFDTPALNVAADVPILGKMTDGILLVTRTGVVDLVSAGLAKERLEQSDQKVLGQVINGVVPEDESLSYYYYTKEYRVEERSAQRSLESNQLTRL